LLLLNRQWLSLVTLSLCGGVQSGGNIQPSGEVPGGRPIDFITRTLRYIFSTRDYFQLDPGTGSTTACQYG
jgi:hypothetical protein